MKKIKARDFDAAFDRREDVTKYLDKSKDRRVNNMNDNQQLALFRGKNIRRIFHQNERWFSVVDVCGALTDSVDSGAYWRKLKQRLIEERSRDILSRVETCRRRRKVTRNRLRQNRRHFLDNTVFSFY